METIIGPSFKKVKSRCYREHKQGFYVYAKPNLCDPKNVIKHIGRYLGRPVIATSRIDNYDGDTVTFHYNRHEDNKYIEETLPAIDFIKRLIRHIPEKHFKMIRYGGLYAVENQESFVRFLCKISIVFIEISINGGPPSCFMVIFRSDCKHKMVLLELYYKHKRVPLEELYEKVMSNSSKGSSCMVLRVRQSSVRRTRT